jgi:hypothetical protein
MADPARWLYAIHASIPACAASGSAFVMTSPGVALKVIVSVASCDRVGTLGQPRSLTTR